jgi:hypothetical protein
MKKKSENEMDDDLRPEYDFSKMRIVARGPKRKAPKATVVRLEPDVARVFPDDNSVNDTLRLLIRLARSQTDQNQSKRRVG